MDALVFYASGILAVIAAALVVTRRNPVYSTIYLVCFFLLVSLQYLILRATFLSVVQVLVYAGAIMVLFLFVIMLLNLKPEELAENVSGRRRGFALLLSLGVFGMLSYGVARSPTVRNAPDLSAPVSVPALASAGETAPIGEALFGTHLLAFEYTSILLLVAIIGAIYLTKKRRRTGTAPTGLEPQGSEPERGQGHLAGAPLRRHA